MARANSVDMGWSFNKKRWRRRILIRLSIATILIVGIFGGLALWVVRSLPGIAVAEISRLTHTRVQMGPVDFHGNASVSIDGLVVQPQKEQLFYDATILRAETVYAKFDWTSLFMLSPRIREIRVEDFILDAQYDLDSGSWNVSDLHFGGASVGKAGMPTISLVGGKLRYSKVSGGETTTVMSVPIEAHFAPDGASSPRYAFDIKTAKLSGGYGDSSLHGSWEPGRFELAGGLSSTDIPSLERAWAVDVLAADLTYDNGGSYQLDLRLKGVHSKHTPEVDAFRMIAPAGLSQSGPLAMLQQFFARYRPFGTVAEISMTAKGNLNALDASEVDGRVVCKDVSVCDQRFPYPIDHLSGPVDFSRSSVILNQLTGKHGDTDLAIQGSVQGYGEDQQYVYQVTSDNMALDEELYAALYPGPKRLWDAFKPHGIVGVDYRLSRSSPTEKSSFLAVSLHDVSATFQSFPYPLRGLTGKLYFDRDDITISNVVASDAGCQIALNGKVTDSSAEKPVYNITLDANNIPLDRKLGDVLPAPQRELYRHFDSVGVADMRARVFTSRDGNDVGPASFFADLTVKKASLRMDDLPEPISNIDAEATITPDSLSIAKAVGRYSESPVSLAGGVRFADDGRPRQYSLKVAATGMPFDDKMMQALPQSVRPSLTALHLEGKTDVSIEFTKIDANDPPEYRVVVKCLGDTIKDDRFVYPLSDVHGTVTVDRKAVLLAELKARPMLQTEPDLNPLIQIDGRFPLEPGAITSGNLTVRAADMLFTEALGQALPRRYAGIYRDLVPRGPFDLQWRASKVARDSEGRYIIDFDGRVDFKTCSLSLSGTGAELAGTLGLKGVYDSEKGLTEGLLRLAADRLTVKEKDFTDVKANVVYDPNAAVWSSEHFLGDCYDGRVLGDLNVGEVRPGVMQYLLTVAFSQVDLEPFLLGRRTTALADKSTSSGTMNAALSLGGQVGDGSSRLGACRVHVVDMQVGKVSPFAKLLAVLSLTEPADYTFERMLIESYLRRNKLLIHKFDMAGKSVAFTGNGTMDLLDGNLNLTLTARGKRLAESRPSVIDSLTEGLGGAVVRMEVTGKAASPQVETKTLPVIEDSLKILGTPR
jgi:hypothetical protein